MPQPMVWRRNYSLVLAAMALALSAAASCGTGSVLSALNLGRPVSLPVPVPPKPATTSSRRVLLVVIDGLRVDASMGLPALSKLAAAGVRTTIWADPPSISAPQYTALLTGVPPRDSGVRTNYRPQRVGLDTVAARARESDRRTVEIGDDVDWWKRLFGADFDVAEVARPDRLIERARVLLPTADFAVVHLCAVDHAGHEHGAATPEYRGAAAGTDASLLQLMEIWNWPLNDVVVVSDHGHVDRGGHGGDEPEVRRAVFVAAGPSIATAGTLPDARTIDVAPTLAAMLGVPAPASAQGTPLLDALRFEPAVKATLTAADAVRQETVHAAVESGRAEMADGERRSRWWRGVVTLMAWAASLVGLTRMERRSLAGTILGAGTLGCVFGALILFEGRLSFSSEPYVGLLALSAGMMSLGIGLVSGLVLIVRTRRTAIRGAAWGATVAGFVLGASPVAAAVFIAAGLTTKRLTCEPAWFAASPLIAYATFAPLAGIGSVLALVGYWRDR